MNILIVGGNGGIGFAMIKECLTQYSDAHIHATYRQTKPRFQHERVSWYQVDVSHDDEVKLFSELFDDIDWVDRDRSTYMEDLYAVMNMLIDGKFVVPIKKTWDLENIREPHESWGKIPGVGSCFVRVDPNAAL